MLSSGMSDEPLGCFLGPLLLCEPSGPICFSWIDKGPGQLFSFSPPTFCSTSWLLSHFLWISKILEGIGGTKFGSHHRGLSCNWALVSLNICFLAFPKVKLCPERAWGQPCINIQKYVGFLNRATQKALIGHVGQLWCKYSHHGWFCISSLMCHCGVGKWSTWSAPMSRWALAAAHPCIHTWGTTTGI